MSLEILSTLLFGEKKARIERMVSLDVTPRLVQVQVAEWQKSITERAVSREQELTYADRVEVTSDKHNVIYTLRYMLVDPSRSNKKYAGAIQIKIDKENQQGVTSAHIFPRSVK